MVRQEFPLATPSVGGYALQKTFTSADVIVPSALIWPKVAGALPILLDRTGSVVELGPTGEREVLDLSSRVILRHEGGALGLALHPEFGSGSGPSPYAFIWYNARGTPRTRQRLSRFTWDPASRTFFPGSELVLLEQAEETSLHNAGHIQFGPDGFLYFGNGDDTNSANDQRIDRALFAGIFRIDVDSRGGTVSHPPPRGPVGGYSQGYFIPNDNPFVGVPNAMEEFFALGFRNPYGFSIDRQTGELWAADVGDVWREEIDLVVKGGNYQWPYREGDVLRTAVAPTIGTSQPPRYSYSHAEMGDLSAVLGGYVYRGTELPALAGKYIYTDWPSCRVWALELATATRTTLVDNQWECQPTAMAEDNLGELYVLSVGGIAKLTRQLTPAVPTLLSQTTLFADLDPLQPEPTLVPYELNSPLWSDGATKQRWISLPPGKQVELAADGSLTFPIGTRLVKQFDLPASAPLARRLETRVLVVGTEATYGLTYRWNPEGTDAELVKEPSDEAVSGPGAAWHFPNAGQCWSCHRLENRVLGFTTRQLQLTRADGRKQLEVLAERGVFSQAAIALMPPGLARPSDTTASLEERATAYLAANCSSCHRTGVYFLGGGPTWNALPGVPLAERGLVGAPHHNWVMAEALGLPVAPLIAPGNPDGSILMARLKSNHADLRMPPLGRNVVDAEGVLLIERWIHSLPVGP